MSLASASLTPAAGAGARPTLLVAGATGLVGQAVLHQAAADPHWGRVVALVRRSLTPAERGRAEVRVVDFTRLEAPAGVPAVASAAAFAEALAADVVVCAVGTTRRRARSAAAFRRVDHDAVVALARAARAQGARHFLLVSSAGANARSPLLYSRVKGEVEAAVSALGYPCLTIARPSLLLGARREFRLGEAIARRLAWAAPRRLRPIHAETVARALLAVARAGAPGRTVLESPALAALGAGS